MKTISIRELHFRTGHFVRAAAHQTIVVTDRGNKVARLVAVAGGAEGNPFLARKLRPGFRAFLKKSASGRDSTDMISEDRGQA